MDKSEQIILWWSNIENFFFFFYKCFWIFNHANSSLVWWWTAPQCQFSPLPFFCCNSHLTRVVTVRIHVLSGCCSACHVHQRNWLRLRRVTFCGSQSFLSLYANQCWLLFARILCRWSRPNRSVTHAVLTDACSRTSPSCFPTLAWIMSLHEKHVSM